jgi:hypothetical protein
MCFGNEGANFVMWPVQCCNKQHLRANFQLP